MKIDGVCTISPDQTALLDRLADMMGEAFTEELWFTTWLSALDEIGASPERKLALTRAAFRDDLHAFAPYEGVYALEDLSAAAGAYRFSELRGETITSIEDASGAHMESIATARELALLEAQHERMAAISSFDWAREHARGRDHINFYAWAVDKNARGTGALRRLLTPFFAYADEHGLDCYLECYADRLQSMYEHLGFELVDELHDDAFDVYERRMIRWHRPTPAQPQQA